jgi:RNA polymerase sigma factor (sigma-70 family)
VKDYNITVKIKNNYMLNAMKSVGIYTAAELSRVSGVTQTQIGSFLNLKNIPYNKNGTIKKAVLMISKTLKVLTEDLFPPQHLLNPLETNTASVEADFIEIQQIISPQISPYDQLVLIEESHLISDAISILTNREQDIIKRQFGLCGENECTLDEIALDHEISSERVRQIKSAALRKLRKINNSTLNGKLKSIYVGVK